MNDFGIWFSLGMNHILDFGGYDHILFVTLLVFAFPHREWKKLLCLILGFTIGHSISMALSVLTMVKLPVAVIEAAIALTILCSAVWEIYTIRITVKRAFPTLLVLVVFFGMIHGLGFSLQLRSLLSVNDNLILPLLYFNAGLELGQLIIVFAVVVFSLLLSTLIKIPDNYIKITTVCIIGTLALIISAERLSLLFSS